MYRLYIGNRTYSSWSLRGWLVTRLCGAAFDTVMVSLDGVGDNAATRAYSPSRLVPVLHDGSTVVWDSLAIAEYLAERHAGMWPADAAARAYARSITAEMHAGFRALRNDMTMCIRERVDVRPWSPALVRDIDRVCEIWTTACERFGGDGEFLFGDFSIADCFYAPVAFRFQTYGVTPATPVAAAYLRALLAHRFVREWEEAANAETGIIEVDEPRRIYRDKLAAGAR
jgi:glutathione S-transferase